MHELLERSAAILDGNLPVSPNGTPEPPNGSNTKPQAEEPAELADGIALIPQPGVAAELANGIAVGHELVADRLEAANLADTAQP